MNKYRIKLLIFSFIALLVTSCYEDKGNYVYEEKNVVTITGLDVSYRVYTNIDNLSIKIDVQSKNENVELEYLWTCSGDTISTDKDLYYPIRLGQGTYKLLLTIREKATGIPYFFPADLIVETKFSRGWYVLKDDGVETELDLHNEKTNLYDILSNYAQLEKLKGKAVSLGYISGKLFLQSERNAYSLKIEDMSLISDYKNMFFANPSIVPSQKGFSTNFQTYNLIDETGIYKSTMPKLGYPLSIADGSSYVPSGYTARNLSDIIYYDELNCRFLTEPMNGNYIIPFNDQDKTGKIPEWLPRDLDADLLYMGSMGRITGREKYGHAILEKRSGNKERLVMSLDINAQSSRTNPITKVTIAPQGSDIYKATIFSNNMKNLVLYYGFGNKLGMYDIAGDNQTTIYSFENEEEITFISNVESAQSKIDKLVIATYNTGNYKVYQFNILAGIPTGEPIIYEGKGRVKEVIITDTGASTFNTSYK